MRIHFFVRTLNETSGGGSHYNSIAYVRALRNHGHDVTVHVFYDGGNAFPSDMTPLVHEGFGRGHLGERRYLADLLRTYEDTADVYFLYAVEFAWGGGLYRREGGRVPVVVYMDAYLSSMRTVPGLPLSMRIYAWKRFLWDKTVGLQDAGAVDRYLPCSPFIGERYQQFGFPKERFTVLPNIVPNAASVRRSQSPDHLTVLYVGRLTHVKGVDLAIEAMARAKRFNAKLVIVGDGELRTSLEQEARNRGVDAEFTGWVPEKDVGRYYETADIFLHAARWPDPAPRTIVAAAQYGLPAAVPDTGGSSWIMDGGALVYPTGDIAALTDALTQLLSSPDLRARLSAAGPEAAKRFEEREVYPLLEGALSSLAA